MEGSHGKNVDEDKDESRPEVAIAPRVGEEDEGNQPRRDLEDVGEEQDESSQWIGVKVEGSSLLNRLVEGERPGEADARGEDRPKLEVAQVGEKVAGTLLVKIHLFQNMHQEEKKYAPSIRGFGKRR